ncbi:hypothetical protein NL676_036296 [Syzygium grande]|nr:hypothetical protein NL676_036296 [Syzygium grande]
MENQTRQRPTRLDSLDLVMTLNSRSFNARTLVKLLDVTGFQRTTSGSRPNCLRHARPAGEWPDYRDLLEKLTAVNVGSGTVARRDCNGAMRLRREGLRQGQLRMLEYIGSVNNKPTLGEPTKSEKTKPNIEVQISVELTARAASSEGETACGQRLVVVVGGGHSSSNFFTDCRRLT